MIDPPEAEENESRSAWSDTELGMDRSISRRDFMDGVAVATAGAAAAAALGGMPAAALAKGRRGKHAKTPYPPALTGLRGSHPGSFEIAHSVRDGTFWDHAGRPHSTGERYDLVIVGAGISGLSAAHFHLKHVNRHARILLVEPHDDFGGHAKRNEFKIGARTLLSNGGSITMDNPSVWVDPAKELLRDIKFDLAELEAGTDFTHYARRGLTNRGLLFSRQAWGRDHFVIRNSRTPWAQSLADAPLVPEAKQQLISILDSPPDWLAGMTPEQKVVELGKRTCAQVLNDFGHVHPDVIKYLSTSTGIGTGMAYDQCGSLDGVALGVDGLRGIEMDWSRPWRGISRTGVYRWYAQDGVYRMPDGNASVARALVRQLIPGAIPGGTMADLVTARCDYRQLDREGRRVRIRLNSTVVRVREERGRNGHVRSVEVSYVQDGKLRSVEAGAVVMACWNAMIPYIAPDFPPVQRKALAEAVKMPLIYAKVGLRNWTAWQRAGIAGMSAPAAMWQGVGLDSAITLGKYSSVSEPDSPVVVSFMRAAIKSGPYKQGARAGRAEVATTSFATYERSMRDMLATTLGRYGLDPAKDIAAVTVNRWPHGYMRWYTAPADSFWPDGPTPAEIGTRRVGRISVACTDAINHGFVEGAIEAASKAVRAIAKFG
ncbi:MAG: NAD(P)-binding protein [Conexibacter sp.]